MTTLYIGDLHLPFEHKNYLKFVKGVADDIQPDRIVQIGDFIDHYALSRFSLDPDVQGQRAEFMEALEHAKPWYSTFPEVTWVLGNHDERPYRKAVEIGLGTAFLAKMMDVYQCPEGWDIVPRIDIDGVQARHGVMVGGDAGWQNYALKAGKSTVSGHIHSVGGVRYHQSKDGKQLFQLQTGCGVDDSLYAFAYGKESAKGSVLGCGSVVDGTKATFHIMDMSDRNMRRIR